MSAARIEILRAGPLTSIQDEGRPGHLASGISASGPMDRSAFYDAATRLERTGHAAIEFTMTGLRFRHHGEPVSVSFAGGEFNARCNDAPLVWPPTLILRDGDQIDITAGPMGNYGYARFERDIDLTPVLGSLATNLTLGLGGLDGRALVKGDEISFSVSSKTPSAARGHSGSPSEVASLDDLPFRFTWGLHADAFAPETRERFVESEFQISTRIDRMGIRLNDENGVFSNARILSLVSDAVVPGDIQILGDGTPIVLMRDHQPTGGYPRIGTLVTADLDRFAQIRPHQQVRFVPVTLESAAKL